MNRKALVLLLVLLAVGVVAFLWWQRQSQAQPLVSNGEYTGLTAAMKDYVWPLAEGTARNVAGVVENVAGTFMGWAS